MNNNIRIQKNQSLCQTCVDAMQVAEAAKLWDGTGGLVFTSSAGLYEVDDGSHCNEDCKIADRGSNERTDK